MRLVICKICCKKVFSCTRLEFCPLTKQPWTACGSESTPFPLYPIIFSNFTKPQRSFSHFAQHVSTRIGCCWCLQIKVFSAGYKHKTNTIIIHTHVHSSACILVLWQMQKQMKRYFNDAFPKAEITSRY